MRSYSWLALCRQHLLSSTAVGRGDRLRKISSFSNRFLHICGYSIGRRPDFGTTEIQLEKRRYIHATASRNAKERSNYEILGVSENASREDIKKAFHSLAKKYHLDANENNPSVKRKFQEIREAYETLRDSEKRAQYDKMRIGDFNYGADCAEEFGYGAGNAGRFRYAYRTNFSNSFHKVFSEIFEDETNHFASDIQVELVLTFSEASRGCTKHVTFDAYVPCDSCDGHGYPANAKASTCPTCRGVGKVTIPPFTSTCSHCRGLGRIIKEHCMSCRGSGVVEGIKEVKVTIPEGVYSEDTIRVPEAGNTGGGGRRPGDLFINLKVADDPVFAREGADVYVDANISFTQAILGGKVEVPTLSGKTQVNIPKGVQPGQLVVLRGKGLPKHGFLVDHGDQYVRFCINFPTAINERQHAILEEFAKEEINNENGTSIEGNWWQQLLERVTAGDTCTNLHSYAVICCGASLLSIEGLWKNQQIHYLMDRCFIVEELDTIGEIPFFDADDETE